MSGASVIMSLKEMIDQSIGTPEIGVVDFSMLHAVLHCIVQQLHVEHKNVELRGSMSLLPVGREHTQTVNVMEYLVDTGPTGKDYKAIPEGAAPSSDDTILVAERIKLDDRDHKGTQPKGLKREAGSGGGGGGGGGIAAESKASQAAGLGGGGGGGGAPSTAVSTTSHTSAKKTTSKAQTAVGSSSTERLSVVTLSKFNLLADTVDDLKSKVYGTMPKNEEILQEVRSQSNIKGITDMWNTLNVQARLEAAEHGIAKLSSLVEDVIGKSVDIPPAPAAMVGPGGQSGVMGGQPGAMGAQPGAMGGQPGAMGGQPGALGGQPSSTGGQPGAMGGQPGAVGGQPGAMGGQPGAMGGQPGAMGGQPGAMGGQPGAMGGQPGAMGGQPGAMGGQPGVMGGQPGAMGGQAATAWQEVVTQSQPAADSGKPPASLANSVAAAKDDGGFVDMSSGDISSIAKNVADLRSDLDNLYVLFYRTMDDVGIEPASSGERVSGALAAAMATAGKKMEEEAKAQKEAGGAATVPGKGGFKAQIAAASAGLLPAAGVGGGVAPGMGPGMMAPGMAAPGMVAPGMVAPGMMAPGMGAPGMMAPGMGAPGMMPGAVGGGAMYAGPYTQAAGAGFDPSELENRILNLEKKLTDCCTNFARNEGRMTDKVSHLENQVDYGLKQLGIQTGDIAANKLSPDLVRDLQGLMQLFSTVQGMQEQLKEVHKTAVALAAEKEERHHHINTLLEQIELLKVIKMDREDMVEAMADKADLRMLARKVSHDQFESACDDLSKGLERAIGKLNMQEALWQQALDDIQREIETKLDKMELSPVKEFFNNKLKQLQENLKQLASLRREVEAAGTKRKLMRDVNCISCDAKAVMAMEAGPCMPSNKPITTMHSMKPYLSYELDAIRKTQASNVPQRNMHDWESMAHQMAHPKPLQKVRSETDKHLCNRYCGGSHTVTTPAQRVARLGHFVKQWGPDVLPLTSGLAAGDDGKMYKVTNVETAAVGPGGAVDTCTPKSPPRKLSDTKLPQKPIIISAECRCLEGEQQKRQ